jgi:hypothetical protein
MQDDLSGLQSAITVAVIASGERAAPAAERA